MGCWVVVIGRAGGLELGAVGAVCVPVAVVVAPDSVAVRGSPGVVASAARAAVVEVGVAVMSPGVEVVCLALVCGPVAGAEGAVERGGEDEIALDAGEQASGASGVDDDTAFVFDQQADLAEDERDEQVGKGERASVAGVGMQACRVHALGEFGVQAGE